MNKQNEKIETKLKSNIDNSIIIMNKKMEKYLKELNETHTYQGFLIYRNDLTTTKQPEKLQKQMKQSEKIQKQKQKQKQMKYQQRKFYDSKIFSFPKSSLNINDDDDEH